MKNKKVCTMCKKNKLISKFHKQTNGKFGVKKICKKCTKELSKECYKQKNDQKIEGGDEMIQNITMEEVLYKWKSYLDFNFDVTSRYLYSNRKEILQSLVDYLIKYNISYEDAKMYTKQVVTELTTQSGRKGMGNYRGWKENVESDYLKILVDNYLEDIDNKDHKTTTVIKETSTSSNELYMHTDEVITAWIKHKFPSNWSEDLITQAHLVGGHLNMMFIEEYFGSPYAKGKEELPKWITNIKY